ncbi:hypothetical protein [Saccharothrix longispora]|uniref:hypothetical protein n=1 Tax=Saccharothrix longispora TaxID=33920 RepID=UPI0028FDAE65|nr:hypothetical protein [Saccharothrix longispora]MDU0288597.1 hypothetical protein [Saccharothrix longispora]
MRIFAWTTLFVCLALTGVWLHAGLTGEDGFAWLNGWLTGPALLVSAVPTVFALSRAVDGSFAALRGGLPHEFRGAPVGIGTVVAVSRTGMSVNDQPQLAIRLQVDTPDGRSFPATAKQVVDLTELGAVQPGAILPVRYLPDGRAALATDAPQHELQRALDLVQVAKGHVTPRQLHISEHGVDAQAVVLAMAPTGEVRNGRVVLRLALRVTRPDGSVFDLTQEKNAPPSAVPGLQVGSPVRVKYLPHDESEVALLLSLAP